MLEGSRTGTGRELAPVTHRRLWISWGVALQAIGLGIPVTVALRRADRAGLVGNLTHYTVRLVWHEMLRSRADVALIVLGVVLFVAGGVVMARPFVRRRLTLFLAVPLAAGLGVFVLGVIAVLVAPLLAVAGSAGDAGDWESLLSGLSWPSRGKRRR
ncbi:MAG TPA: hypothetical protein VG186_07945 [Solirubrobacteraceae bacterium]|jgi:hypothetical protein|nr:hypothetical protein [Solirubrobacteraceae bacterium]